MANRFGLHGPCRGESVVCFGNVILPVSVGLGAIFISLVMMFAMPKPTSVLG